MEFLVILLLLIINGLFALYEMAFVSASKVRLESMASGGSRSAQKLLDQQKNPEKTLSTIQIGITLVSIISGAYGGNSVADDFVPLIQAFPALAPHAERLAMALTIVIITFLSLIIGELVPKSIALSRPERWAVAMSPIMRVLMWIAYPIVWILSITTRLVNHALGVSGSDDRPITQEELKVILHQSSEQGVIDKHETEMLRDVFRFSDKRVNELMTPRPDVVALDTNDDKEKVLLTIQENNFSKYPLIDDDKDEVVGVVSVKDMILLLNSNEPFDLKRIARPALFIPETLDAKRVVELFKNNKTKFAIIVNEYGGTEGIITLHDLTESIFGDILEENEPEEHEVVHRNDGSLLVDASMNLDDFMDEVHVLNYEDIEDEGFTTLGGMAMFFIGRIPKPGDTFDYRHIHFEVIDMDGERVDKLLVTIPEDSQNV